MNNGKNGKDYKLVEPYNYDFIIEDNIVITYNLTPGVYVIFPRYLSIIKLEQQDIAVEKAKET